MVAQSNTATFLTHHVPSTQVSALVNNEPSHMFRWPSANADFPRHPPAPKDRGSTMQPIEQVLVPAIALRGAMDVHAANSHVPSPAVAQIPRQREVPDAAVGSNGLALCSAGSLPANRDDC